MSFEGWKEVALSEVIEFNPRENLKKGTMAQKVSMADIEPFTRKFRDPLLKSTQAVQNSEMAIHCWPGLPHAWKMERLLM